MFSQAAHLVASLDQSQREALHDNELELLRQVDIIDVFVTKLAINCVNFRKTFCVFTGGTSGCWAKPDHA